MENNQLEIVRFKTSHNTQNELSRKCHAATRASFNSLRITLNTPNCFPFETYLLFPLLTLTLTPCNEPLLP